MSPRLKLATKFVGVIERAVVNEGNFTRAIDVGVRILIGLPSVGGPTGVCDADVMPLGGDGTFSDKFEAVCVFSN